MECLYQNRLRPPSPARWREDKKRKPLVLAPRTKPLTSPPTSLLRLASQTADLSLRPQRPNSRPSPLTSPPAPPPTSRPLVPLTLRSPSTTAPSPSPAPAPTIRPSYPSPVFGRTDPPATLLGELFHRFVLTAAPEPTSAFNSTFFLIQKAHWHYEDRIIPSHPHLRSIRHLREFARLMFRTCSLLQPHAHHFSSLFRDFALHRAAIPVRGAILLDPTCRNCLLVRGWEPGASWSFPRGKKEDDEDDRQSAVREVLEETGFDVSSLLKDDHFLDLPVASHRVRLYIVAGVSVDTVFAPLTDKEVGAIRWQRVDDLVRRSRALPLFEVLPFLDGLASWISEHGPSPMRLPTSSTSCCSGAHFEYRPSLAQHAH